MALTTLYGHQIAVVRAEADARSWPAVVHGPPDQADVHLRVRRRLQVHVRVPRHRLMAVGVGHRPRERHEPALAHGHAVQVAAGPGEGHALLNAPDRQRHDQAPVGSELTDPGRGQI